MGELVVGPRVSLGLFTQLQTRADLAGQVVIEVVRERVRGGGIQAAMAALMDPDAAPEVRLAKRISAPHLPRGGPRAE